MPTLRPGLPARLVTRSTNTGPVNPRAGTPAGPPAQATGGALGDTSRYDAALLGEARRRLPDGTTGAQALLRAMSLSCAQWLALSPSAKVARIQALDVARLWPAGFEDSATQARPRDPYAAARLRAMSGAPSATPILYSSDAVAQVVAILDAACLPSLGGGGLAPAGALPSTRPQTNIGTPNRDLWNLANDAPNDLLAAMGLSCVAWLALTAAEKTRHLNLANVHSFLRSRLDIPALRSLTGHPRHGGGVGTGVGLSEVLPPAVESVISLLDQHCFKMQNFALARGIRPAGRTAFTEAASYTNGPTLLAVALAFAGGYAVRRYLAR